MSEQSDTNRPQHTSVGFWTQKRTDEEALLYLTHEYNALADRWTVLHAENVRLAARCEEAERALFRCYELSGADTDGCDFDEARRAWSASLAVLAPRAVEDLRRDYDESLAAFAPDTPGDAA